MDRSPDSNSTFSADRLNTIAQIEDWHFWFRGRWKLIHQMLVDQSCLPAERILDLGCGTGKTIQQLASSAIIIAGIDLRAEGLRKTHSHSPKACLVQAAAEQIPLNHDTMDGILLLDLLEHTEDRQTIQEITRILKPGGWMILSVPVFPFLWSYRDDAAGHRRRYTRQGLVNVLNENLQVVQVKYYQFFLFPLVMATRILGRQGPQFRDLEDTPLPVLNTFLTWASVLEASLSRWINFPWGSTLLVLCRK